MSILKAREIVSMLKKNDFEAYIVGGYIRSVLIGVACDDIDIATSATPIQVKKCFESSEFTLIETGIKHGTQTLIYNDTHFEITTFRTEGKYSDFRHPDEVFFTKSLEEDVSRRDFTMNALALSGDQIIDYFGGKEDIKNKIIRTVGNPHIRFAEDALRILRALRFAATLGFTIEEQTKKALFENKGLLKSVSQERIISEFNKLIMGDNAETVLLEYKEIIAVFIPEILPAVGFDQKSPFHSYDVYTHNIKALVACEKKLVLRLAMFFHDLGKPECFILDQKHIGHFRGHAEKSADLAWKVMRRLKYDNDTIKTVYKIVMYHYAKVPCDKKSIKLFLKNIGVNNTILILAAMEADNKAKNKLAAEKIIIIKQYKKLLDEIVENNECYQIKDLEINGDDLINQGYEGQEIGEKLEEILLQVISEEVDNNREKLLSLL